MDARLQVLRAGVQRQFDGEPAKERADLRALGLIERGFKAIEIGPAERNPDSPGERVGLAENWDFEAPMNKEIGVIRDAGITGQGASPFTLSGGNRIKIKGVHQLQSSAFPRAIRHRSCI